MWIPESGAGGAGPSALTHYVHAGRGRIGERVGGERGIAVPAAEPDLRALAERIDNLHPRQAAIAHAQSRALERSVPGVLLRLEHQPLQSVGFTAFLDQEIAVEAGRVEERGERAVLFGAALRPPADLLEVRIVDPDGLAIGHDQLRIGLFVFPAEQARRRQRDAAAGRFAHTAVVVEDLLGELPVQALEAPGEAV